MPTYTITQFKAKAGEIIDNLEYGDEVIITRRGKPCAKLEPVDPQVKKKGNQASLMGAYRDVLPEATWEDFQEAKKMWRDGALPEADEKPSPRSLMGILATPNTPDWDYEELQGHIREIRDGWKVSTYAILEEDAR